MTGLVNRRCLSVLLEKEYVIAKIIVLTGGPGAGKSSVGRSLAEALPRSVHLKVDDIRESVVGGFHPPGDWSAEAVRQFKLARSVATGWARNYADAGFTVVLDDVCVPEQFSEHYAELTAQPNVVGVLLKPNPDALAERITERGGPYVAFFLETALPAMQRYIDALSEADWLVVDSSAQSVEQTTQILLEQLGLSTQ